MTTDSQALCDSVLLLTMELSGRALGTDWSDPSEVQHAERLMKVLSAYGRNIEKCIAMTESADTRDNSLDEQAEAERLRAALYHQLVRYADRLGPDELARRLELDRADAGTERVEILGSEGSIQA